MPIFISRHTGERITELEHIRESLLDILSTPLYRRTQRGWYGSKLNTRVDKPVNRATISDMRMDVAEAVDRCEPRVNITNTGLDLTKLDEGIIIVSVTVRIKATGAEVDFDDLFIRVRGQPT